MLSEQSGRLKKPFDLMRYCYVKKCPLLFVSITVAGVIRLNSAGPSHQFLLSLSTHISLHSFFPSPNLSHHYPSLTPLSCLYPHTPPLSSVRFLSLLCCLISLSTLTPIILSSTPPLSPPPCLFKHSSWMSPSNIYTPKNSPFLSFCHPPPHTLVSTCFILLHAG